MRGTRCADNPTAGIYTDQSALSARTFANKKGMENRHSEHRIQLISAVFLVVVGAGLLIAAFVVDPTGEIHSSVLVAFGETLTFAGAVFGVDYARRK